MDNKKLITSAGHLDTALRVMEGFMKAFAIVFAVFFVLVKLFGEKMAAGTFSLDLDYVKLHLAQTWGGMPSGLVRNQIEVILIVGLIGCIFLRYGIGFLRRILAPMKEGRPFDAEVPVCPGQQDKLAGRIAGKSSFANEHLPLFNDIGEVEFGIAEGAISYHSLIRLRNPDFGHPERPHGDPTKRTIETTAGRVIFNAIFPEDMGFWNDKVTKSTVGNLILDCHRVAGHDVAVKLIDDLKNLGYNYVTVSGASISGYNIWF